MSRSFIAGSVAGLALSVVGLATVSLMAPLDGRSGEADAGQPVAATGDAPPAAPAPPAEAVAATTVEPSHTAEPPSSAAPAPIPEVAPTTAPTLAKPEPETAILDVPQGSEFTRPKEDAAAAIPAPDTDPAEGVTAGAPAPAAVAQDAPRSVDTVPAAKPDSVAVPAPGLAETLPVPDAAPAPPVVVAEDVPAAVAPPMPAASPDSAGAHVSGAGVEGHGRAPEVPPEIASAALPEAMPVLPTPAQDAAPDSAATSKIALPAPDDGPVQGDNESADKPRVLTLDPAVPEPEPVQAMPGGAVPGVNILRLPGTDAPPATLDSDAGETPKAAPLPPRRAFAARWQNPDEKPVMGVVILDRGVGAGGLDPAALAALPFAVTIAVDPLQPDAAAAAAAYRAAGDEVAILIGNEPAGATPADFEVAYQSFVQTLPQTVAVIGSPDAGFLRSSLAAQHLASLLAADGRGLVTYDQGLNPGRRAAEKAGVPVASIDKLFGAGEENMGTLARELDRAAFAAGQKGQLVVALPSTPDAVTALIAWATGPSGSGVSLAPVSAVMEEP